MIEKKFPRKLNKSADSRRLAADEMSDALNINVSEDGSGEGNSGVIKPLKSNTPLDSGFDLASESDKTVLGKVSCDKYNVIYFFVYNADDVHGIYDYDPDEYLPGSNGKNGITKVFESIVFNFQATDFIKADITYVQRNYVVDDVVYEDVPFIFFTDNQSEPKKINVLRAITEDYSEADADINDFLFACPKTPTTRVQAFKEGGVWENYEDYNANEFLGIEGFQFAFQNVYKDGSETALSSFSDIFVPPGYLQYSGSSDIQILNQLNMIQLTIPNDDMSSEVESVKLLCRRGNSGSWFLLKEFDYDGNPINYQFLNDEVNSAVSQDTQIKQFDNLPQRAEAQAIIGNRLMYGNYVDGFDQSTVEIDDADPQLSDRPSDFESYEVEVLPSSCPSPYEYDGVGAQNKNMGFTIDGSNLPDQIAEGSFISFSFTVQPKQNFHIYNATNSYHQSPQMGEDFDVKGIKNNGIGTNETYVDYPTQYFPGEESPVTGHPFGQYWQSPEKSGGLFIETQLETYEGIPACCSDGANKAFFPGEEAPLLGGKSKWKWQYYNQQAQDSDATQTDEVDFGTSAANPLIIQGQSVTISCSFVANQTLTPLQVIDTIAAILSGETFPEPSGSGGGEVPVGNTGERSIVETNARDIQYPDDLSYSIDLGLGHGSTIPETSPKARLITMVGGSVDKEYVDAGGTLGEPYAPEDTGDGTSDGGGGSSGRIEGSREPNLIKGFFVVNKANVSFGIFRDLEYNEEKTFQPDQYTIGSPETTSEAGENLRVRFGMYVKEVDVPPANDSVLSCFRRPLPGAQWWCFAPFDTEEGVDPFTDRFTLKQLNLYDKEAAGDGLISLPGFAMSHNLSGDYLDAGSVPQDKILRQITPDGPADEPAGAYSLFNDIKEDFETDHTIQLRKEASIFVDGQVLGVENARAPWRTILGGLYYNPDYENEADRLLFHQGEDEFGTPMYSLMDGAGGPGSTKTVDSNSPYDRYICNRAGGQNADDYLVGIGKLGSAPLFGFGRSFSLNVEGVDPTTPPGGYGPILSNNILIATNQTIGYNVGDPTDGWLNYKLPQMKGPDDALYGTQDNNFISKYKEEVLLPLYWVSSMPMIHGGSGYIDTGTQDQSADLYSRDFINPDIFLESYGIDLSPFFLQDAPDHLYANQLSSADSVNAVITASGAGSGGQTFKAGANHAFGLVFYDERGRSSNVTPLGSVYVPWFGERADGTQGLVSSISIDLLGEPPEGASKFRFVYSGNTTMSRFVQYSTAGAFVSTSATNQFSGNIYVSLNHLQQNSASFAKSYGARGLDGSQDIYTFREGDRLRIISYYEGEGRIFTSSDYEFNIVDQVVLGEGDDNPLYNVDQDGAAPHKAKVGSFLVLENNTNALGFTYDQVKLGENDPDATSHYWGSRCVVEIYSPKTSQDEENLVYYEIGDVKDIDALVGNHIVTGGDVWWRTVPVNFQKFENAVYKSIITNESSDPNFLPYNVESQVFNEKVRNSDVWGKGKVKVYLPDEERSVKSSSITYSDKDNPISKVLSLTSFNPAKAQYKDLPAEFGDINYMINNDDSIFVIQSNRCSSVPVNRNLITDGGGSETLVAAREVLGTERYYAGNYGCDNIPESVCNIGNTVYFASKSNRQVYKFNPSNGIQVISDAGMKGYFKKLFEKAEEDREALGPIKVVGGYDPYNDNYILSVYNQTTEYSGCVADPDADEGTEDDTVTVASAPVSVTIDVAELYNYISGPDLFALASGDFGEGTVGTNELISLLSAYGRPTNLPTEITIIDQDDDGVTFNYPSE